MSTAAREAKTGKPGRVSHITPENAGWSYVGFDLHRLKPGETASGRNRQARSLPRLRDWPRQRGSRRQGTRFPRRARLAVRGQAVVGLCSGRLELAVTAGTDLELAVCSAPGLGGGLPVRVIAPETLGQEVRGKGTNTRYVTNILPESEPADSLLVVEVITPGGHTSSYPPHKHDQDNLPAESYLEETYYHRLNPPQGFAFQRVYTDDRSLDESMAVEDGDVVMVPKGYHPCAACHGYDLYYLNVMAGPKRTWKFHNAKEHEWLMKA